MSGRTWQQKKGTLDALKVSDMEKIFLPMREQAQILRFRVRLIISRI